MAEDSVVDLSAPGDSQNEVKLPPEDLNDDARGNRRDVTYVSVHSKPNDDGLPVPPRPVPHPLMSQQTPKSTAGNEMPNYWDDQQVDHFITSEAHTKRRRQNSSRRHTSTSTGFTRKT